LPDAALADHVRRAAEFLRRTIYYHHRLNCCAMVPLADFLVHATTWTGLAPQEILQAMRGRSPLSAGATAELESLRVAIIADGQAMLLLLSDRPAAELVAEFEALPGAVGAAMRAYLSVIGLRVVGGYDVADRHAREHPELLLNVIRAAVTGTGDSASQPETEAAVDAVRQRVPSEHRAGFDALLREARLTYRVRDERNFCSDSIGVGLARRAILTAGERLRSNGRAEDASHLVDASEAEIVSLLERGEGPHAGELAARYQRRMTTTLDAAPDRLGLPPSAPPPADWLPGGAARLQRAIGLALDLMFAVPKKADGQGTHLSGFGVSPGVFEGPARVILDVADLPTVRAGEVLVTPSTGPTFNVVLPLLKALVTERGGALSHAAIVAREYGIPAVVGCVGATAAVKTGTLVRVDGNKGEMWIVG
jgi:pyruvate,water dikinase